MNIVNLTQHKATPDQIVAGVTEPKNKEEICNLLTFKAPPTSAELEKRARKLALAARNHSAAMIGGAPYLMGPLERALREQGVTPLYSFSIRESVETAGPDGSVTKTQIFRHAGFVGDIPDPGAEVVLASLRPVAKGVSLELVGPRGINPFAPFCGDIVDLGVAGHARVWRIRPGAGPWLLITEGKIVAGGMKLMEHYLPGGGSPATWKVIALRPGAIVREFGYKQRTSTDSILDGGVLRRATVMESLGDPEGSSAVASFADKLREAGIIPGGVE